MNNTEKSFKNLSEIVQASEDDIKNNNKNVTAILDLDDLKALRTILFEFEKLKQDNYKLDRENQLLFEIEEEHKKLNGELNVNLKNSIPKKKIEDKILQEWQKCPKNSINDFAIVERDNKIQVLQELLEE